MKKKFKGIIILMVVVAMLSSLSILASGCTKGKKAIIILPGIMGSAFENTETKEPIWDPFEGAYGISDLMNEGKINLPPTLLGDFLGLLEQLKAPNNFLTEFSYGEGYVPNNSAVKNVDYDSESGLKYGPLQVYKDMAVSLTERYGKEYDVKVFHYDWRADNKDAAKALEQYVKKNNYKDIVLIGHSMGGMIASDYVGLSKSAKNSVEMFISLGAPFFGAWDVVTAYNNLFDYIPFDISSFKSMFPEGLEDNLTNLIRNFISPIQLFPFAELNEMEFYKDNAFYLDNGKELESFEAFNSEYLMKSDLYKNSAKEVKKPIAELIAYQNSQFVKSKGEKVHISRTINTYYFVGTNTDTVAQLNFNGDSLKGKKFADGDGTVLTYSALAGTPIDASNVFVYEDVDHMSLASSFSKTVGIKVYELIDSLKK